MHKDKRFFIIKKGKFIGIYVVLMIDKERWNVLVNMVQRCIVTDSWIGENFQNKCKNQEMDNVNFVIKHEKTNKWWWVWFEEGV